MLQRVIYFTTGHFSVFIEGGLHVVSLVYFDLKLVARLTLPILLLSVFQHYKSLAN